MRQWAIDPRYLCNKHLNGEHNEHHMMRGSMMLGRSWDRYFEKGLIDPTTLKDRHDEIEYEMLRRGMNHRSPFPDVPESILIPYHKRMMEIGKVPDFKEHIRDLSDRCHKCRESLIG